MSNEIDTDKTNNNVEPILLIEYENIPKEHLININGTLYHIETIYKWIIINNNDIDPLKNYVSDENIERIKNTYDEFNIKNYLDNDNNEDYIIYQIKNNKIHYKDLSEKDKNNKKIILEIYSPIVVKYFSDELKNDKEFALQILKINGYGIQYLSDELKNDSQVALVAFHKDNYSLSYVSNELKNTYEFMIECIKINPFMLQYASNELKNNYEMIKCSVSINGCTLQFTSNELKNKYDIALIAVKNNRKSLQYVSNELKNNDSFLLEIMKYYVSNKLF